jgi:predicted metal-dependent hydrolase
MGWTLAAGAPSVAVMTFPSPADGAGTPAEPRIEIVRSRRRRRTVSAYRDGDRTVVLMPAGLSAADEQRWVEDMMTRLARQEARRAAKRPAGGDSELAQRAATLSERYLSGRAKPSNVRWVTNQNTRWGSCTPANGTIRLSDKLRNMPPWVVDYVIVHELAHLLVPGHGPRFWALVELYPRTERARGFLEGVALTAGLQLSLEDDDAGDAEDIAGVGGAGGDQDTALLAGDGPAA